jgi:tetratricopeptide (TPR) repeat protein
MKLLGSVAAALGVALFLFAPWVFGPISTAVNGLHFSLFGSSRSSPGLGSFGVLSAILVIVAAAGLLLRRAAFACAAGAGLLVVALWAWLHIAVGDPHLLDRIANETAWTQAFQPFIARYVPGNFTPEPELWSQLSFDTLFDRLYSGWYFLALTWYLVPGIGVFLFFAGAHVIDRPDSAAIAAAAVAVALVLAAVILWNPAIAQLDLARAVRAEAGGRPDEAIHLYRDAIQHDGWYRENIRLYVRIGGVEAATGNTFLPEYKAYQAENLVADNQGQYDTGLLPSAIAMLDSIVVSSDELSRAAARREASVLTVYGAHLFNTGAFGAAVKAWETARIRNPELWLPALYLTRGYILTARYQDAAKLARETIPKISDPSILGDLYDNLGDAERASGHMELAREAYSDSYRFNYGQNRRALNGMVGP